MAISEIDALALALQDKRKDYYLNDPYAAGGNTIINSDYTDPRAPAWQNALVQAIQGFTGGTLQGYGRKHAGAEYGKVSDAYLNALAQPDPVAALGKDYRTADLAVPYKERMQRRADDLLEQTKLDKAKLENELVLQKERNRPLFAAMGRDPEGNLLGAPQAPEAPQNQFFKDNPNAQYEIDEAPKTKQLVEKRAMELSRAGIVDQDKSYQAAMEEFKPIIEGTNNLIKQQEELRSKLPEIKGYVETAKDALSKNPSTGFLSGTTNLGNYALAAIGNKTEAERVNARNQIDTLQATIRKMYRSPGEGQTTNADAEAFLKAGVSVGNEEGVNRELLKIGERAVRTMQENQDYLNYTLSQGYTPQAILQGWEKYQKAIPRYDSNNKIIPAEQMPSWRDVLAKKDMGNIQGQPTYQVDPSVAQQVLPQMGVNPSAFNPNDPVQQKQIGDFILQKYQKTGQVNANDVTSQIVNQTSNNLSLILQNLLRKNDWATAMKYFPVQPGQSKEEYKNMLRMMSRGQQ